ncbi:MAG TPA: YceI family protein [Solirubrobacteraceae bacterium]|jgi:polyisoprenoid-binding protein YceI|nr:YceI family protein [Solirubrobacteraceae bacterium]
MSTISAEAIQSGTYNVDPSHSNVGFAVRHMGIATVRGQFKKFAGAVEATGDKLTLSGSVETASVDTGDENRDGHLQSPEFFDAAQFAQITFTSTGTEPTGDGQIKLTGEITIKGTTKPIELVGEVAENGQDPWGNQRIGFEVEGKIDRREFGLEWNQTLPNGNLLVANEVKLIVSVSAVKAA